MSQPPVQTSGDEVHAHAHRTGRHGFDLVIAISAITISVISLFVAIEHGRTEEKLVAANSWPFLVFQSSENGLDRGSRVLDLRIVNSGVGPARVQSVKMTLDGKAVTTRAELMADCCAARFDGLAAEVEHGLITQNEVVGVVPAREGVSFLGWRERSGNQAIWDKLDAARHRLKFEACYCSVLDECWISDLTATARPKRVGQCEAVAGYQG